MERPDNVRMGWSVWDVVKVYKTWCVICAKARAHEAYEGKVVCLACCNITDDEETKPFILETTPEPGFQLSKYLKGE